MLIDKEGNHKFLLKNGERKSLNTDKIIIVPGSNEEIEIVRWIFEMYASNKLKESEIVKSLNNRNIKSASNTNWTIRSLRYLLSNEQYIGNIIFNKSSYKLQTKRVINAPNMWIRSEGVIKPIVDKEMFYKAQERLSNRRKIFTNEELIEKLSALYQKHQKLTSRIISKAKDMPCDKVYSVRFGSLMEAYRLVGFDGYYNYSRAKYVLNHVKFKESIKNQVKTFEQLSFNF